MQTQLIQVPYDSGRKDVRMGNGPGHLVRKSLAQLKAAGVHIERIETDDAFPLEAGTTFKVLKLLSERVRHAAQHAQFPLILAGGCISCVGTLAGLDSGATAVVWLDAHGDFNTPETTLSGFLDGMALATATGTMLEKLSQQYSRFSTCAREKCCAPWCSRLGSSRASIAGQLCGHADYAARRPQAWCKQCLRTSAHGSAGPAGVSSH